MFATAALTLGFALGLSLQAAAADAIPVNKNVAPGMRLIAVNGDKYSADVLRDAITTAHGNSKPIELLGEILKAHGG